MTDKTNEILARLIRNTKRQKRIDNIVTIAGYISFLENALGSIDKVSELVGISKEMLRKFLAVDKIDKDVRELTRKRQIDSVAFVNQIKKLPPIDQKYLAELYIEGSITTEDLKAIIPYQRANKGISIENAVENVLKTKDIKTYVIVFSKPESVEETKIKEYFDNLIGQDNIYDIDYKGNKVRISLLKKGLAMLYSIAKEKGITLKELVEYMIEEIGSRYA